MTTSVIVWVYVTHLCYLLHPVCTGTTYTSKACYGSDPPCTRHHVKCNSTQKVAIYKAYYTDNTNCPETGISSCGNFSTDSVKEDGYHKFNITELVSLYNNCSTKGHCEYRGPRRNTTLAFSVVKYQCLEGRDTETAASHDSTTNDSISSGHAESDPGAIAGGVVATIVAVVAVTLVSVWIIRRRRAETGRKENTASLGKDVKPDMTYSLAGKIPQNRYHEIQDRKTQNSDYDYATTDGVVLPPITNTYFTIEPAGKLTARDNSTGCTAEGDYDHIGDKPPQQTGDYDTTVSVAQPGNGGEDDYGYNHVLREANPQTHQNDYDTTASAAKAVAKISSTKRNTDEDDYDHFHRGTNAPETVSSPYDTTSGVQDNSDYSVAGQMK